MADKICTAYAVKSKTLKYNLLVHKQVMVKKMFSISFLLSECLCAHACCPWSNCL